MSKKLTKQICEEWKTTDRIKNPLTGKLLDDSLKRILVKRCRELGIKNDNSSPSSFSPWTLIKAAEKHIFKHKLSSPKSSPKSSSKSLSKSPLISLSKSPLRSLSKSLSAPNSAEISDMRENLPYLFDLSFHDFEKMQSDNHRIDTVLLNYDITDPVEVKHVKKFIKYIINIPNAKNMKRRRDEELSDIIQSKKYKKVSFKDLPDDAVSMIGKKYYDIMATDVLHKWIPLWKLDVDRLSGNNHKGIINIFKNKEYFDKINWSRLTRNPAAIDLLKANQGKIDWKELSSNPAAIELLEQNQDKISWGYSLSTNPGAVKLLELEANVDKIKWNVFSLNKSPEAIKLLQRNPDKIKWMRLSSNPTAIKLLERNQDKIDWYQLSLNPAAIKLLEKNQDKLSWGNLSSNPAAIKLLEQHQDKIAWNWLSRNPNPGAIKLLKQNQEKIDWEFLSSNPAAIKLLERNQDKIHWSNLSRNPAIFHK